VTQYDAIVIGSGATGSMAAQTLVDGGANVLVLDGGQHDDRYAGLIPQKNFVEIRRTDPEQYRYFLGEHLEGAAYDPLTTGAQLTPPRRFIVERVDDFLKVHSQHFVPMESLALGGLGSGWGLLCGVYSDAELAGAALPAGSMREAYQTIANRIGISGADDDARPFTYRHIERVQPPLPLDPTAAVMRTRYERQRARLQAEGYHLGRPALALLTEPKGDRQATALRDMDFYCDAERAAWRPSMTIESLRRRPNVDYAGNVLATRFEERDDGVDVVVTEFETRGERRYSCRRLVLAAGVLGTARIVLRSLATADVRLPLLCNTYTYAVCIVPGRIGKSMPEKNTGLVQLVLFHDADQQQCDIAVGTIFSYRSLMLFRLLREVPLGMRDARILMQYLLSGLLIVGIDHPQASSEGKRLWLEPDATSPTGDVLCIDYELTDDERRNYDARERAYLRVLRQLGAWPIKRVRPPLGSSIHYAGTLPFSVRDRPFTLSPSGRLHGTRRVFVADGSGFTFLPAKGVTLSLMANAHRVAKHLLAERIE
jgi:choline dehydrogenase-like flavoprotein